MECVFCKIISGEASAHIMYKDDITMAIVPLDQIASGHVLVIPKQHFESIFDVDDAVLKELISVVRKLSSKLLSGNKATGVNILNASGKDAQQSVNHLHFHIIPRYPNDDLDMWIKQGL